MIPLPATTKIWLACGATDMRKGFDGLAVLVQQSLKQSPHSGALFAFRGRRGDLIKLLWYDGQGLCLFSKRMDRGRFVWPVTATEAVHLTPAQLSMLLEGIDWRRPERAWQPKANGKDTDTQRQRGSLLDAKITPQGVVIAHDFTGPGCHCPARHIGADARRRPCQCRRVPCRQCPVHQMPAEGYCQ